MTEEHAGRLAMINRDRDVNEAVVKALIRDTADPASLDLAAGLISDRLLKASGTPDVGAVIAQARIEFASLFRRSTDVPATNQAAAGENNPFARGPNFNMTKQAVMIRDDPARAARLRNEAEATK